MPLFALDGLNGARVRELLCKVLLSISIRSAMARLRRFEGLGEGEPLSAPKAHWNEEAKGFFGVCGRCSSKFSSGESPPNESLGKCTQDADSTRVGTGRRVLEGEGRSMCNDCGECL